MKGIFFIIILIALNSCSYNKHNCNLEKKKVTTHYKIGDRYTVKGITYTPRYYDNYEEVGVASWYGKYFHNKLTANGDIFDSNAITAAHKTLPLPSFVKVTNLENGRSLIVKVNDRGPFIPGRIIDVSERAAKILGFHKKGIAKVKVKYLKKMTQDFIVKTPHYKKSYVEAVNRYTINKMVSNMNTGYISKFSNPYQAKKIISKLRSQGLKNVRFVFRDGNYYVHVIST